jgi:hypothetical protein
MCKVFILKVLLEDLRNIFKVEDLRAKVLILKELLLWFGCYCLARGPSQSLNSLTKPVQGIGGFGEIISWVEVAEPHWFGEK